jgi:hypothetical protein
MVGMILTLRRMEMTALRNLNRSFANVFTVTSAVLWSGFRKLVLICDRIEDLGMQ